MCGQHNVRASTKDNTDKGHTPNPRIEIKIPDPAGNRTWAAGLEGRDHTTTTDLTQNLKTQNGYMQKVLIERENWYPNWTNKTSFSTKLYYNRTNKALITPYNNNNNDLFKEQNMVTIITNTEIQVVYVSFAIWD